MGLVFFFAHPNSNFSLISGSYSQAYHLNDSKISKQKYGEYLDKSFFGL